MATLYRQYRPQRFADLVGQDHIRQTLQAALAGGTVAHAYLFAGPRGVGKTTVARLLAKAINCERVANSDQRIGKTSEPCNQCQMCADITEGRALDVLEIDAASNRGIDEIRELREKIKFAPSAARTKVYIIDEVHMLTKEAFNALLKTLEEPPAHAKFILATTELHRVPVTIASRCQVFLFKKATPADLVRRIQAVAETEGLALTGEAADYLARLAAGSYRDALSLLDQLRSARGQSITAATLAQVLGLPSHERLLAIFQALSGGEREGLLNLLAQAEADGLDLDQLANLLIDATRQLLHLRHGVTLKVAVGTDADRPDWERLAQQWAPDELAALIVELAAAKAQMKHASIPLLPLELVMLKFARQTSAANSEKRIANRNEEGKTADKSSNVKAQMSNQAQDSKTANSESPAASPQSPAGLWPALLERVRAANMGLYGLLKQAEFIGLDEGTLKLQVPFAFARDRIRDRKHQELLLGIAHDLTGESVRFDCAVCPREHVVHHPDEEHDPNVLTAAVEVFEIEESPGQ